MRVRVRRNFSAAGRTYRAGEVVDVDFADALAWAKSGLVMQDKSLDGGSEAKRRKSKKKG